MRWMRLFCCGNLPVFLIFLLYFHSSALSNIPQEHPTEDRMIAGIVLDRSNRAPLVSANISLLGSGIGTACDSTGQFVLQVPAGKWTLIVRHIGYATATLPISPTTPDSVVTVYLQPEPLPFPEIAVEAQEDRPQVDSYRIEGRHIKNIPDFTGDAYAAIKTLPAVASNNELSNSFNVQGGSVDENLVLLEGVEISAPQRIRTSSQENISPINSMLVQDLTITQGGFAVEYGERLSSVVIARYRDRAGKKLAGTASLSPLLVAGMIEGQPIANTHWAIATRYADRRWILGTLQTKGDFAPRAYDIQGIMQSKLSPRHRVLVLLIAGENAFTSEPKLATTDAQIGPMSFKFFETTFGGKENFTRRAGLLAIQFNSQLSPQLAVWQSLALGRNDEHEDVDKTSQTISYERDPVTQKRVQENLIGTSAIHRDDKLREHIESYRLGINWHVRPWCQTSSGIEYEQRCFHDALIENEQMSTATGDTLIPDFDITWAYSDKGTVTTRSLAAFVKIDWSLGKQTQIATGLRWSNFRPYKEQILQPRVRLLHNIDNVTRVSVAWGLYAQPVRYHEMRGEDNILRTQVPAQRATHWVAAMDHVNDTGNQWQLQVYYKRITRLIPYELDDIFIRYQPQLDARGEIYGASWHWQGELTPRMTSWLSYGYLSGKQHIAGEGQSRLPTDQRHTFSAVLQDNMPELPGSTAHIRFLFGSGYPYTPVVGGSEIGGAGSAIIRGGRNSAKLNFYRRLDVGLSYSKEVVTSVDGRITFEIFNLFDFRNALAKNYFIDGSGQVYLTRINLSRRFFSAKLELTF